VRDVAAVTAKGGREHMEDFARVELSFAERRGWTYAAVFDGHGGEAVSRRAANEFHELLAAEILGAPNDDALRRTFRTFDERVKEESSGTTAVVLLVHEGGITAANAGDSHALLVRGRDEEILTTDHRLANESELRRVQAAGARISGRYACLPDGRGLMCTRSLGDREFRRIGIIAEPEVTSRTLTEEDVWILSGSDGVWDGLEPELVARIARTATAAKDAAERIRDAAVENNRDNVSVVAVRWA